MTIFDFFIAKISTTAVLPGMGIEHWRTKHPLTGVVSGRDGPDRSAGRVVRLGRATRCESAQCAASGGPRSPAASFAPVDLYLHRERLAVLRRSVSAGWKTAAGHRKSPSKPPVSCIAQPKVRNRALCLRRRHRISHLRRDPLGPVQKQFFSSKIYELSF